ILNLNRLFPEDLEGGVAGNGFLRGRSLSLLELLGDKNVRGSLLAFQAHVFELVHSTGGGPEPEPRARLLTLPSIHLLEACDSTSSTDRLGDIFSGRPLVGADDSFALLGEEGIRRPAGFVRRRFQLLEILLKLILAGPELREILRRNPAPGFL